MLHILDEGKSVQYLGNTGLYRYAVLLLELVQTLRVGDELWTVELVTLVLLLLIFRVGSTAETFGDSDILGGTTLANLCYRTEQSS